MGEEIKHEMSGIDSVYTLKMSVSFELVGALFLLSSANNSV